MTAFNKTTDLPATVDTVEKLASWALLLLYRLHKNDSYSETPDTGMVPLITLQQGLADDETERLIFRTSLQLNPDWQTNAAKLWTQTQAFANATIPESFKS
jgi:hypothetical protein